MNFQSFTPSDTSLLVVAAKDETTRMASRIDLASGDVSTDEITVPRAEKHAMPNELPPNVQPTAGVLLALDRQEKASGSDFSAVQEVRSQYQIPVVAVINLSDLMQHVSRNGQAGELSSMRLYRERYGLAD